MNRKMKEKIQQLIELMSSKNYEELHAVLEGYSVKELEDMAISVKLEGEDMAMWPSGWRGKCTPEYKVLKLILEQRKRQLNRDFQWTPENIERICQLDKQFIAGFEKLKTEARAEFEWHEQRIAAGDSFLTGCLINGSISPYIFVLRKDGEIGSPDEGIERILDQCLPSFILTFFISNEDDFNDIPELDFSHNWNKKVILPHGQLRDHYISQLKDHYISSAIGDLFYHTLWSFSDILRINHLWCRVSADSYNMIDL